MSGFNLADIWESCVDRVLDREALTIGSERYTYADIERSANQFAGLLIDSGIGPGDNVGCYLQNSVEYVAVMIGCFKVRAVPINVNYRYTGPELVYLFNDAELAGVVFQRAFTDVMADLIAQVPTVRMLVVSDDADPAARPVEHRPEEFGAVDWNVAVAQRPGVRPRVSDRSGDDFYVMYTGGTTGMPKGVVWRHEDAFFSCIGGGDPMRLAGPVQKPEEMPDRVIDGEFVAFPCAPMIHAAAQWTSLSWWYSGARVVFYPGSFDPFQVWQTVERERVNTLIVVGDAMARPMIQAWDERGPFDVSSLFAFASGGATLSPATKAALGERLSCMLTDGYGSSETGAHGVERRTVESEGGGSSASPTGRFAYDPEVTAVFDDDLKPIEPGSEKIGRIGRTGRVPLRYYGDPARSEGTFVELEGRRWVITGDDATVEEDGTIALLGRGSGCINTGGEKVYPEEVEGVLRTHDLVTDALVVGSPDERWGSAVVAVVEPAGTTTKIDASELTAYLRTRLAGYKVPKRYVTVDQVQRTPAGKPDYRWAQDVASSPG